MTCRVACIGFTTSPYYQTAIKLAKTDGVQEPCGTRNTRPPDATLNNDFQESVYTMHGRQQKFLEYI